VKATGKAISKSEREKGTRVALLLCVPFSSQRMLVFPAIFYAL